jgi:hypothetical protein
VRNAGTDASQFVAELDHGKSAPELDLTFYLRVASLETAPLIAWLATQYPSIGGMFYSMVKPGVDVMK